MPGLGVGRTHQPEQGKNLGGPYKTRKEAEKRLMQVEYFDHSSGK